MKRLAHLAILVLLLLTSFGHGAAICLEPVQSDVACEDGCCLLGHELSPPPDAACCTIGSQPDAEFLKLRKQASQPNHGTPCAPLVSETSRSLLIRTHTTQSPYLRDASNRYLQTRALLI